ncbi:MAG TPA: transglutaminaseTgpA domain-containing protein [Gaiellaceae bacterium]
MPNWRPALLALVPGVVLMQNWLRLEDPQRDAGLALLLIVIAAVPALAPRFWQRLVLLAIGTLAAIDLAVDVPVLHPWRAESRVWNGFLDFYEVRLPFNPSFHPGMHALLLLAGFGFTAAVALAAASRRPVAAVACLVVGAGWPATLLSDGNDLLRGGVILATSLFLLAGLRTGARRTLARAALLGGALVAAALAATTQPAVAKSEFLQWQTWNPYQRPPASVGVRYVWDANYDGFSWPRKTTTVLKVQASPRSVYWRATTLDVYDGTRWIEQHTPLRPQLFDGRLDLTQNDPLAPSAARNPVSWKKVEVEVEALADNHLVAPSVPVGYGLDFGGPEFWQGGTGTIPRELQRGDRYTAWSYSPSPTPRQLASARGGYPAAVTPYLEVLPGHNAPSGFGSPSRDANMRQFLAVSNVDSGLFDEARRIVGNTRTPYGAALALESWFRSTGGFKYTTHPPRSRTPLLDFVLHTKRGYCQHFAGAMALMLRYLGIPARVAEGFVSGTYDPGTHTWTVTDHDAHAWVEVWFAGYGWLPFDPTPGRGFLTAGYSVSSPQFHASAAANIVGGVAASLLNTASIHQDVSFGDKDVTFAGTDIRPASPSPGGAFGIQHRGGSLGKLLAFLLGLAVALVALAKAVRRHLRYATPDPRGQAAACRADLRDFLADQGIRVDASLAPEELSVLLRTQLEVDGEKFATALAAARFGPPADASAAAARARAELSRLRAIVRKRLGVVRRARGLVSLRSLGFAE